MKTKRQITPDMAKPKLVPCKMVIAQDGRISFRVRGYEFKYSDMDIDINGYLFRPVRKLST